MVDFTKLKISDVDVEYETGKIQNLLETKMYGNKINHLLKK